MAKRIPTALGDILILHSGSISTYAIGVVSHDGQQDFHGETNVKYLSNRAAALAEAKALAAPGQRIFFLDVDAAHKWREVSD